MGPQAARFVMRLHERQRLFFTLKEAAALTGLKMVSARSFIRKLVNRGIATRLKPGLYNLVPFELGQTREHLGNPYLVARELAGGKDYYLSHASAMDIHGMTTQPQLITYVTSPFPLKSQRILGMEFRFIRCKDSVFFGVTEWWVDKQNKVWVSDLERTILDGVKAPRYCGGVTEVAKSLWMRRDSIDYRKLIDGAIRLKVGAVVRRLGFLLESLHLGSPSDIDRLRPTVKKGYVLLDPLFPVGGPFDSRWRIRLNINTEEIHSLRTTSS